MSLFPLTVLHFSRRSGQGIRNETEIRDITTRKEERNHHGFDSVIRDAEIAKKQLENIL